MSESTERKVPVLTKEQLLALSQRPHMKTFRKPHPLKPLADD